MQYFWPSAVEVSLRAKMFPRQATEKRSSNIDKA